MNKENPSYYAIIPADVRYDEKIIPNAKLLFGEITCLSNKEGYCFASNSYFANLYNVTPQAVSRWIKSLEDGGYIKTELIYEGKEVKQRKIYLSNVSINIDRVSIKSSQGINKKLGGYQQKVKDNNTSINNININNTEKPKTKKLPLIEREPENDIERVEKQYLLNYQQLYRSGIVHTEKPVVNWLQSRKLTKQVIETYGVDTIIKAVKDSINNDFCVQKGYCLTMILSAGVLSGLINGNNRSSGSVVKRTGVDTVTQKDLDNLAF